MKHSFKFVFFLLTLTISLFTISCSSDDDPVEATEQLVGNPGNPRFNLQFTNPDNVDLDLYVQTPSGVIISYSNPNADGGTLDVDCLCFDCPQGPNENIFWENGTAPTGDYEYWVDYYSSCNGEDTSSSFTLRVLKNSEVVSTRTGTLSSGQSSVWTHNQE
jgi:uncharacterized protein YfaP (DUF2135 family)